MINPRQRTAAPAASDGRRTTYWIVGIVAVVLGLAAYVLAGWRAPDRIVDTYGQRSGLSAGRSVNGTAVLARLFEQQGARVSTWERLSPRLKNADTIVWIPDDFEHPKGEHCDWFEEWLADGYGRTLIYVGRDFEGRQAYWKKVKPQAPPEQAAEVARQLATAQMESDSRRIALAAEESGAWFNVYRGLPPRTAHSLSGPWSDLVDASQLEITLGERYEPPILGEDEEAELLLGVPRPGWMWEDSEPLIMRITKTDWSSNSQILVATNGSFLLNYGLVNHEHRELAHLLIEECEYLDDVVFLESDEHSLTILERDPDRIPPSALQMLMIWPMRAVTIHAAVLAVLLCFALFPVFGRALRSTPKPRSDFENHIFAVGQLMAQTQDTAYARERIQHYQERVRRDSGASHTKKDKTPARFTPSLAAMTGAPSAGEERPSAPPAEASIESADIPVAREVVAEPSAAADAQPTPLGDEPPVTT